MRTSELTTSKFLKKEDFPKPVLATIREITKENIAPQGQPKKDRGVMYFEEYEKGLVLNSTNLQMATQAMVAQGLHVEQAADTDNWIGRKLVIYVDPNVSYSGQLIGGLRVRGPKTSAPPPPPPARPAVARPVGHKNFEDMVDDDINF